MPRRRIDPRSGRQNRWRAFRAVWTYIRRAPGTFIWLLILLFTTHVAHRLSPGVLDHVLGTGRRISIIWPKILCAC